MCRSTDSYGKNQADAGQDNGSSCMLRRSSGGLVGLYEPILEFAGAGASVPLLGFGNVLWKGIKQAVDESGFLGLFKGGFTACASRCIIGIDIRIYFVMDI